MIIHTTNIFAGPLILIIWAIDIYLLLASLRFINCQLQNTCTNRLCQGLKLLIDPVPEAVGRLIAKYKYTPSPSWLPWFIVILAAFIVRHLLIWIIAAVL